MSRGGGGGYMCGCWRGDAIGGLVRLRQGRRGGAWEGCRAAAGDGVCVGVAVDMPSQGSQYLKELPLRLPGCGQQG